MKEKIYLHPAIVRVWHWINGAGFLILIITGLQIRFAETLNYLSLKEAVILHNYVGLVVIVDYALWYCYYLCTGKIALYYPNLTTIVSDAVQQLVYYSYGIFKGMPNPHTASPEHKFNALQQSAYLALMLICVPAQIISGIFLWQIKDLADYIDLLGGIRIVVTIHVLLFYFFVTFIIVHSYLATLGRTPATHFKAMFTGYEEHD